MNPPWACEADRRMPVSDSGPKKTRRDTRRDGDENDQKPGRADESLLPRTLLVAIRLQALSALVLVHLETTLLLQIAHLI